MAKMIASRKLIYGTRRLKAGDDFDASTRDARVLHAIGRASYATKVVTVQPDPAPVDDIADVRAEYERVVGKRPFMGWDTPTLRQKMAEAGAADTGAV